MPAHRYRYRYRYMGKYLWARMVCVCVCVCVLVCLPGCASVFEEALESWLLTCLPAELANLCLFPYQKFRNRNTAGVYCRLVRTILIRGGGQSTPYCQMSSSRPISIKCVRNENSSGGQFIIQTPTAGNNCKLTSLLIA